MVARAGSGDTRTWRAPGRINVIGDHTDYQEGLCLPMAIDRECRVAVGPPATADAVTAGSAQMPGTVTVAAGGTTDPASVTPDWGRFVAGAVAACVDRGVAVPACSLTISSTVPAGSGLSSSSALSVALVVAFADLAGASLDASSWPASRSTPRCGPRESPAGCSTR